MAVLKFSEFRKKRKEVIEKAEKTSKLKKYNEFFNEKLKEFGVESPVELSEEDQIKFYDSLKPIKEDLQLTDEEITEINSDDSDDSGKDVADAPKDEDKDIEDETKIQKEKSDDGSQSKEDQQGDKIKKIGLDDDADGKIDKFESASFDEIVEAAKIDNEGEFKKYAEIVLKKAHGENYDESKSKSTIDGLIKKYGEDNNWGSAVGALQSGLGEAIHIDETTYKINSDDHQNPEGYPGPSGNSEKKLGDGSELVGESVIIKDEDADKLANQFGLTENTTVKIGKGIVTYVKGESLTFTKDVQ